MERVRLAALVGVVLLVLLLVGSMLAGLGGAGGSGAPPEVPGDDGAGERVRVEVLNAAGVAGLARTATERLREAGFDVVYYGNASTFGRDTSWVLDRVGRPEAAEGVAASIGIERVRAAPDTTLYVDVTVLLGRDWAETETPPADSTGGG